MWERGQCYGLLPLVLAVGGGQKHELVVLSLHGRWTVGSVVFCPCGGVQLVCHGTTASGLQRSCLDTKI